jgi:MraZ protein
VEENPKSVPVYAPRGIFPARVDDKGRLKLPAGFKAYLDQLGEKDVFVTSFDGRIARIYTNSIWAETERYLSQAGEDHQRRKRLYHLAMHYGADSRLDDQGRILINSDLRREMAVESQPVKVMFFNGVIQVWSEAVDQAKLADAKQVTATDIDAEEMKGLR